MRGNGPVDTKEQSRRKQRRQHDALSGAAAVDAEDALVAPPSVAPPVAPSAVAQAMAAATALDSASSPSPSKGRGANERSPERGSKAAAVAAGGRHRQLHKTCDVAGAQVPASWAAWMWDATAWQGFEFEEPDTQLSPWDMCALTNFFAVAGAPPARCIVQPVFKCISMDRRSVWGARPPVRPGSDVSKTAGASSPGRAPKAAPPATEPEHSESLDGVDEDALSAAGSAADVATGDGVGTPVPADVAATLDAASDCAALTTDVPAAEALSKQSGNACASERDAEPLGTATAQNCSAQQQSAALRNGDALEQPPQAAADTASSRSVALSSIQSAAGSHGTALAVDANACDASAAASRHSAQVPSSDQVGYPLPPSGRLQPAGRHNVRAPGLSCSKQTESVAVQPPSAAVLADTGLVRSECAVQLLVRPSSSANSASASPVRPSSTGPPNATPGVFRDGHQHVDVPALQQLARCQSPGLTVRAMTPATGSSDAQQRPKASCVNSASQFSQPSSGGATAKPSAQTWVSGTSTISKAQLTGTDVLLSFGVTNTLPVGSKRQDGSSALQQSVSSGAHRDVATGDAAAGANGSSVGVRGRVPPTAAEARRSVAVCVSALWNHAECGSANTLSFEDFRVHAHPSCGIMTVYGVATSLL